MMQKRRIVRKISYFLVLTLVITSFVLIFSLLSFKVLTINAVGSASVQPLLTKYSLEYTTVDVNVEGGGSGRGISAIKSNQTDLGNVSRDPELYKENNNLKTITLAIDAIAIIYKLPPNCLGAIDINNETIPLIYEAFSGIKQVKYSDLGIANCNIPITPVSRTGGSKASGTAESFYKTSGFKDVKIEESVKEALEYGAYGPYAVSSNEANSEAFKIFEQLSNGIVYLSAGYVITQKSFIEKRYKIATYNSNQLETSAIQSSKYNWIRPLNTIVNLSNIKTYIVNFIEWMINFPSREQTIFKTGFVPLTENQKQTMYKDGKLLVSDYDLGYSGALLNGKV
jgi:phosphate transport system substrate-binding protein